MGESRIRHLHGPRTEELSHEAVDRKGVSRRHHLVARPQEGVADELDDLIRAIAENHILPPQVQSLGNGVAQRPCSAIGIKMGPLERLPHGLKCHRRGAERIFI